MNKKKELQECWKYVAKMIRNKNNFDVGFLHKICNILLEDDFINFNDGYNPMPDGNRNNNFTSQNYNSNSASNNDFTNSVIDFLTLITEKGRKNQQFSGQYLALIVIDSIIFNLYARNKNVDKFRPNNSFYNSMSMSQMSDQLSQQVSVINNEQDLKIALTYIENLALSANFFKKLKLFYDRSHHKNKNHHYLENLLQTIEYILNKQKISSSKDSFLLLKDQHFKTFVHTPNSLFSISNSYDSIQQINEVIFSNQLNKIVYMLTNSSQQIFFSLNRIYFVGKKGDDRKHFRNVQYNASDMIYNLNKNYIESFSKKLDIFEESKNPLFILIKSFLICFFLPTFKRFCQIIIEFGKSYEAKETISSSSSSSVTMIGFYKINQHLLEKQLLMFIQQIPLQLIQYLNILYRIIQKHYNNINTNWQQNNANNSNKNNKQSNIRAITTIKRFFIYSFLVEPQLVKQHIFSSSNSQQSSSNNQSSNNLSSQNAMENIRFEQISNFIINLFFSSSVKKYTSQYTSQQLTILIKLSQLIQNKFEEKIINYDPNYIYYDINDQNTTIINNYFIEQPILNHDYQIIDKRLKQIEFTPKDGKNFQMKKQSELFNIDKQTIQDAQDITIGMTQQGHQQGQGLYSKYLRKDQDYNSERHIGKQFSPNKHNLTNDAEDIDHHLAHTSNLQKFYHNAINGDRQDQVDFLTWMTVGGNHNYRQKPSKFINHFSKTATFHQNLKPKDSSLQHKQQFKNSFHFNFKHPRDHNQQEQHRLRHKKKKQFVSLLNNKQKISEINNLYEQYNSRNIYF